VSSLYTISRVMFCIGLTWALVANASASSDYHPGPSPFYAPYPVIKNPTELVKRGEYLTKMGDCIACHTDYLHHGQTFAGGLAIKTPFGTFYSPNITPDKKTGIGNWSEADFVRALKEGRNPKGHYYFPVFPFIYLANLTDEDARAMYAYFMSIPPVEKPNKPLPFPFNLPGARLTLLGWNLLFYYPRAPFAEDAHQTPEWNRGKYIVEGLGHCSMCHTPLNPLGAPKLRYYLSGAFIDGYWAPNITRNGLKPATHAEVMRVFNNNELINQAGPVAGPMSEVNHDSLMYLTDADLSAIITYIETVESVDPQGLPPSNAPPSLARGREVYQQACVICHQNGQMSAPIIGNAASWFNRAKNNTLITLYQHVINGYNSMPPRGACTTCSDNDIMAAVDYVLAKSLTRSQSLIIEGQRNSSTDNETRENHAK